MTRTQQLQTTFHDRKTGRQHGPTVLSKGSEAALKGLERKTAALDPAFPRITARMIRSERTTIGFSDVSPEVWAALFPKKGKWKGGVNEPPSKAEGKKG